MKPTLKWTVASLLLALLTIPAVTQSNAFGPISVSANSVIFDPNDLTAAELAPLAKNGPNKQYGALTATLALSFTAASGQILTISAAGLVSRGSVLNGPDGLASGVDISALKSISGFRAPVGFPLVGVFTTGSPNGAAPVLYDYSGGVGQETFSPLLNQVFFIGDGLTGTGSGSQQFFKVPPAATALWLGFADSYNGPGPPGGYGDNSGALTVTGTLTGGPSLLVLATLSNNIYDGNEGYKDYHWIGNNCTLPPNTCGDFTLAAGAYANANNSQIVIAIRGSIFNFHLLDDTDAFLETYGTALADISFGGKRPTALLSLEVRHAAQFVQQIESKYPDAHITLTGHSLGGAVAQLLSPASGLSAYVFNAPGAEAVYAALRVNGSLNGFSVVNNPQYINVNYRLYGEQISLLGQSFGATVTFSDPSKIVLTTNATSSCAAVLHESPTLLGLHLITVMVGQIANNAPQVSPSGEPNIIVACHLPQMF